jgi:hypothetical protein
LTGKKSSPVLNTYIFFIFLTGLAVFTYILFKYRNISVVGVVLFGLLAFAAENLSASLPAAGSVSINNAVLFASLILFGPSTTILVTAISFLNIREFIKKVPYYKHFFNAGQYLVSVIELLLIFLILLISVLFFYLHTFAFL